MNKTWVTEETIKRFVWNKAGMYGSNDSESFTWFMQTWNVKAMLDYIKERSEKHPELEPGKLDPAKWVGMTDGFIYVDREYAMGDKCTSTEPVIAIEYMPGSYLVVDGWHRLYRAHKNGLTEIPVWILYWDEQVHFLVDKQMVDMAKRMAKDELKRLAKMEGAAAE